MKRARPIKKQKENIRALKDRVAKIIEQATADLGAVFVDCPQELKDELDEYMTTLIDEAIVVTR